jgi:GTP cyclohydrolase I
VRDLQSERDLRGIGLNRVGVRGIKRPMEVLSMEGPALHTVGRFCAFTDLPPDVRGSHMSRIAQLVLQWDGRVPCPSSARELLSSLSSSLGASASEAEVRFPFFVPKASPVTRIPCPLEVRCRVLASLRGEDLSFRLAVKVPVKTLCPCSREISSFGAHNQRARVTIEVGSRRMIWIEELVAVAEENASSPVYPVLKRQDERFVTEGAYMRPRFVEDLARDCAARLLEDPRVESLRVRVVSHESIHDHDAVAEVIRP